MRGKYNFHFISFTCIIVARRLILVVTAFVYYIFIFIFLWMLDDVAEISMVSMQQPPTKKK
jgi:hypothetical protein